MVAGLDIYQVKLKQFWKEELILERGVYPGKRSLSWREEFSWVVLEDPGKNILRARWLRLNLTINFCLDC